MILSIKARVFSQAPEKECDPPTYIRLIVDPHKTVQNPRKKPSYTSWTSDIKGPRRSGTDTAQSADTYRWCLSGGDSCCRLQLLTRQRGLLFFFNLFFTVRELSFSQPTMDLKEQLVILAALLTRKVDLKTYGQFPLMLRDYH